MKKLVIFDIDKTIYDGNLYEDILLHLISKKLINQMILPYATKEILELKLSLESYEEFILDLLQELKNNIEPKKAPEIIEEVRNCVFSNKHKFRNFAFEIPKMFPNFQYLIISLEPHFVVEFVAQVLQIPHYLANYVEISNKKTQKYQVDKFEMLKNSQFSNYEVWAVFGDSELDYTLLLEAKHKFVFNPSSSLAELIKEDLAFKIINPDEATSIFEKTIQEK